MTISDQYSVPPDQPWQHDSGSSPQSFPPPTGLPANLAPPGPPRGPGDPPVSAYWAPPGAEPAASPPVSWDPNSATNQLLRGVLSKQRATGFDNNLKAGTVVLLLSLIMFPIVLGPTAAYFGLRSHRDGNPIGQVFAIGSLVVTATNLLVVVLLVAPRFI